MMRSPERLAGMLHGEVGVGVTHLAVAIDRPGQLGQRVRHEDQRLLRGAQHGLLP